MAHREIRDDERCGKNTFAGVHVWQFTQQSESGLVRRSVACRMCDLVPREPMRARLIENFERALEAQVASDRMKQMHKEATGLGRRRA